jgi:RNA polymerase sigma-70 factor (ECF subfamily)
MKPGDPDPPSEPVVREAALPEDDRDEAEWVEGARGGDAAAFRRLVERHRDRAYGLSRRMLRSEADAEEVAQDAFVRAWRALPAFRGEARFGTWLHQIVVRLALDRLETLRRRRQREPDLEAAVEPAVEGPDHDARLRAMRLERMVSKLNHAQRAAVTLYYYEERSVEEVAGILQLPENTVKTHLSRARAALREAWLKADEKP